MKIFVATIIILISLYIIKVDLFEGTIPLAFFSEEECIENNRFHTSRNSNRRYIFTHYLRCIPLVNLSLTKRD